MNGSGNGGGGNGNGNALSTGPTRHESSSTSSSSRSTSLNQASSFLSTNNSTFRSIALVDYIQFKFEGNISKHGIVLADCDNDGKNELVLGTLNGELYIFKDSSILPLTTAKDLGMNYIVTISIEGCLNIYAFNLEFPNTHSTSLNPTMIRRGSNFGSAPISNLKLPPTIADNEEYSPTNNLILHHSQQIQANALCALLADIDNDGSNELIVALSDRVVRSYRAAYQGEDMKLVGIHKWEFSDQIGSISLSTDWSNMIQTENGDRLPRKDVLVAQNGGVYAKLSCYDSLTDSGTLTDDGNNDDKDETELYQATGLTPAYKYITGLPSLRNPQISSEIISDIKTSSSDPSSDVGNNKLISMVTADGCLMLLDDENIRWQCQLEQKMFSLRKYDIDNDGRDELVICTWNGQTYLVNVEGRIVICLFDQPVSAFAVGTYDLNGHRTTCLVYVTFTNSVYLYFNIECSFNIDTSEHVFLDHIRSHNPSLMPLLETLVRRLNAKSDQDSEDTSDEEDKFAVNSKLIHAILYGVPTNIT